MVIKKSTLRKTKTFFKRLLILIIVIGVAYLSYWFTFGNVSKITSIEVIGAIPDRINKGMSDEILTYLNKNKFLWFIPENHITTYSKNNIVRLINKELPNIESIFIKTSGLHSIFIQINPRIPVFKLLNDEAIDKNAIIYKEENDISALPLLTFSTSTYIPTGNDISSVYNFLQKISTRLFDVTSVDINSDKDIFFYDESKKMILKYHNGDDTDMIWNTLLSALDTAPLSTLLQNKKSALEYIDLRFGNKVFYKFFGVSKDQLVPSTSSTTNTNAQQNNR